MNGDYDGRQYVGIDLHRRRSVIVRMTEEGEQLGWVRIDNDPVALGLELAKAGPDPEGADLATFIQRGASGWTPRPVKRVFIPKANGKQRGLGIRRRPLRGLRERADRAPVVRVERRQVTDIAPSPPPYVTEYRIITRTCPCCAAPGPVRPQRRGGPRPVRAPGARHRRRADLLSLPAGRPGCHGRCAGWPG